MTLWPEHGEILGQLYREVGKAENEQDNKLKARFDHIYSLFKI